LRFLNAQCIRQGFESEEDYFPSDLTLAQWARDARIALPVSCRLGRKSARSCSTKQAKKRSIELEPFTTMGDIHFTATLLQLPAEEQDPTGVSYVPW
jgi:hypothetical protein